MTLTVLKSIGQDIVECTSAWVCLMFSSSLGRDDGLGGRPPRRWSAFLSHRIREYMTAQDLRGNVNLDRLVGAVSAVLLHREVTVVHFLHLILWKQDSKSSPSASWGRRNSCPARAKEILSRLLLNGRLVSSSSCSYLFSHFFGISMDTYIFILYVRLKFNTT